MVKTIAFPILMSLMPVIAPAGDTSTRVFCRDVRSLSLSNPDDFMAPPVIRMASDDRLVVNFDIIGENHDYLRYRLIHCDAGWQPSRLLPTEYIDGFNEDEISDYAYSSNTYVHYVNYNLEIPNDRMRPLVSGNYLLQVYPEGREEDMLLQQRFFVSENIIPVSGYVTSRTDRGFNTGYQQLGLDIDLSGAGIRNPYQDLIVTVTQNNRPETTRILSQPLRIDGQVLVYAHNPELIFNAGNEYRRFETVRADYAGMHVDSVNFGGTNWHAWLSVDEPRAERDYSYDRTQHGRFKIDEYNADDPDLAGDYITVHFSLDHPEIFGKDIYVDGDFTLHQFNGFNRMRYDYDSHRYSAEIPLKQGSYNYQYVVTGRDGNDADPSPIDGDKYETCNEYLVLIYYRPAGARYDRLLSSQAVVSYE